MDAEIKNNAEFKDLENPQPQQKIQSDINIIKQLNCMVLEF